MTRAVWALWLLPLAGWGQEIQANITFRTDQIQSNQQLSSGPQFYNDLQAQLNDFVSSRRWTNDQFRPEEKINLEMSLIVRSASAQGDFDCQATIQVTRPVFGTSYQTVLLRFVDRNFAFKYQPGTPLIYNDNSFNDNLTSLLAFYSYIALALDYDSFGRRGGEPYIQRAFNVANLVPSGGPVGWSSGSGPMSRYWLIENLQNQQMLPFRDGLYTYHRLALDSFAAQPEPARRQIIGVLTSFRAVNQQKPGTLLMNSFFDGKADELVNLFSRATPTEKQQAFGLLSNLDPTKTDTYRRLLQ